jgi:hypothetical protein
MSGLEPTHFANSLRQGTKMAGTAESRSTPAKRHLASPVPYVEYDEFVEIQIARTRDSLRTNEIITALTQLALLVIGYLLVVVILDQWIAVRGLSSQIRLVMLLGLLAGSGYLVVYRILWPLLRRIHPLYAARVIEQAESRFQGNLVNWIDLKEAGRSTESSAAVRAIEKRAAVGLDRMDVDTAVDRRPLMQAAYALLGVVVLSAMYVAFSPKDPFSSVHRALLPLSSTGVATETTISDITPGDVEVTARSQVTVEADLRGKAVERAQILLTTADRKFVDHAVEMRRIENGLPRFRGVLNGENGRGLLQDVEYRIVANDAQSEIFHIRVIQPPAAQIEQLTYTYPAYMQLEPRQVPGPAVDAWEGTKVTFEGRTNLPVSQARLILTDSEQGTQGEEVNLRIEDGTRFSGSWTLGFRSDGTAPRFYHVAVKTTDGLTDPNPVRIPIDVRADQRPEVALLFPTSDLEKPANAIIPLAISASDPDFQLRSLTLKSERNGTPLPDLPLLESEFPTRKLERTWEWDLGRLGLQPGERVQYWIEARDNRQPVANRTNTPRLSLLIQEPFDSDQQTQQDLADARQQLADDLAATPSNPNPGEAADPQEAEQPQTESTESRPQSEDLVGRGSEPGDDGDTQPKNPEDRTDANDADEQTEFQNQLERLLNREERQPDSSSRTPTGDKQGSSASDGAEESPSADEPEENRGASESEKTKPDAGAKASSTRTGRDGKKAPGESGAESSRGNSGDGDEGDSIDSAEQPKSTGPKPERATPKGSAGKQGSTQGSKQSQVDDGASEEQTHGDGGTPSATERSPKDRRPTDSQRRREDGTGTASTPETGVDPTREQSATGQPEESGDTAQDETQERNSTGGETKPGPKASSDANPTGKPAQEKEPNRNSSSPDGDNTSAGEQPTEDGEETPSSNRDGLDPSAAGQQPKSLEPPAGQRPPRPGQEPKSQSKPERSEPSANSDSEESDDQQSSGDGESQQSGESSQIPGKTRNSAGQQAAGTKGGMKSNPGGSDPKQPPATGSSKEQGSQPKPTGGSKTGQPQGAGNKSPANSESSPEQGTGNEPGTFQPESGEQDSAETSDTERSPRGKQAASKSGSPKSKREAGPRSANSEGESSPSKEESAPRGKQPDESQEHDDPPSDRDQSAKGSQSQSKRPNNPAEVGNQTPKGQGRPQGQQSQQPAAGENWNSSASDQGDSGGNQEGAGESTTEPGQSQPAGERTGQSKPSQGTGRKGSGKAESDEGDSRFDSSRPSSSGKQNGSRSDEGQRGSEAGSESSEGEGSQGEAGDSSNSADSESGQEGGAPGPAKGKSGGDAGQTRNGQGDAGKNSKTGEPNSGSSGNQAGGSSSASQPGQGGEPSGTPSASSGQSGAGRMGESSPRSKPPAEGATAAQGRGIPEAGAQGAGAARAGDAGSGDPPASDEQKLDQLKEASSLILEKLKGQLSRGEVDEETLQDLGWKDLGQLRKFVSRLEEGLADTSDEQSPEAQARRRQFEEMLKSLRLDDQTETRARGTGTERRVDQVDAGRRPVPSSLRERYEAYTRSLSKPGSSGKGTGKPAAPPPATGKSR